MSPQFLKAITIAALLHLPLIAPASADQSHLPVAQNLAKLGALAGSKKVPILLLISQYHCSYCDRMKQEILQPMRRNGDFQDRVVIRELLIDAGEQVIDFRGKRIAAAQFSQQYGVFVTPTLLFLDNRGDEVAEPILGINTLDYLVFYILDAIEHAANKAYGS
jgi:thioredoxin-related protein